jgi:hypothetical protein
MSERQGTSPTIGPTTIRTSYAMHSVPDGTWHHGTREACGYCTKVIVCNHVCKDHPPLGPTE